MRAEWEAADRPEADRGRERFELLVLARLEQILRKLEILDHDIDALDRGLKPYGDGVKVRRR